ncbi:MAG: DEAD/DEAH box helicase, partial [Clostridia bacterium]|nr:DEAD/DEAH box helicase [Clostridia bacterium]
DFEKTKAKVKYSLKELAFNLVELYSKREHVKGYKFEVDKKLYEEFENSFPYEETADQISTIKEVLSDMTSGKVMDRIVCGDVGYGKTEVALRSAFVSAINGKQTAFLAPTTVLSEQHFNNAKSRFENFGISVECLNRFKTKAEQKEIVSKLKNGDIDIVCGTHRLLSSDVQFKDLGLLILDEEQRFGVGDKEKIKRLKTNVDVLTLSATPIPRTLHMGLVGIRDISLITTPPSDRLPVQTTVCEYSDAMLLQAIKRELARDGQVLIIYNKVESIYQFSGHVRDMVGDDVSIGVAHGQMEAKLLESEILNLYQGKTKILVSTTLIENGVDLPSANTLFVINADHLGLSQLYQLKGRVGRSKNLGYAYFTFDRDKALSEDAYKRLNAIMEFTELGSGFKIAMKDLEIRGCGNILGAEQSGHMAKVGYDLYCKILSEVVGEIKGQKQKEYKDIKLDVAINCYIPENFIENNENRFRIYESLKQIDSKESQDKVLSEIKDLFGNPPEEIVNLSFVARLR